MRKMAELLAFLMGLAASKTAFDKVCGGRNIHKNIHGSGLPNVRSPEFGFPKKKRTKPRRGCMEIIPR
jgi:hypothetical protein